MILKGKGKSAQSCTTLLIGSFLTPSKYSVRAVSAFALMLLVGAFAVSPAYAWEVSWSRPDVLYIERSADATTGLYVKVYVSASGEQTSTSNTALWDDASWIMWTNNSLDANQWGFEVTVPSEFKRAYVQCQSGSPVVYQRRYYLTRGVDHVVVDSMPAVDATITSMPSVSLDSSISVDGTLPVSVSSMGGVLASDLMLVFGWLFGLPVGVGTALVWRKK